MKKNKNPKYFHVILKLADIIDSQNMFYTQLVLINKDYDKLRRHLDRVIKQLSKKGITI